MKGLDYPSERYVRLYSRDTVAWSALCWEAQALYPQILRKVDRAGVLDLGDELLSDALSAILPKWPLETLERAAERLIAKGFIGRNEEQNWLFIPKFEDAETAKMTSAQRSREHRAREAARTRMEKLQRNVAEGDATSRNATRGDTAGHPGTRGDSVLSQPVPPQANPEEDVVAGVARSGFAPETDPSSPPMSKPGEVEPASSGRFATPSPGNGPVAEFEKWWALYPKKTGKRKALQRWKSISASERPSAAEVIRFIERASNTDRWRSGYVKGGDVFVGDRAWEDDLEAYGNGSSSRRGLRIAPTDSATNELRRRRSMGEDV